jgi:hypothetical protein
VYSCVAFADSRRCSGAMMGMFAQDVGFMCSASMESTSEHEDGNHHHFSSFNSSYSSCPHSNYSSSPPAPPATPTSINPCRALVKVWEDFPQVGIRVI